MRPPLPFAKPAMPKTCSTCTHWKQLPAGARSEGPIGECRERSPQGDFKWPRTKGTEYCSCYASTAAPEVAFAERGPDKGPGATTARQASEQLSLVADQAAPKPTSGKTSSADAPGATRPRAAKASPKSEAPAQRATGPVGDE